MSAIARAMLFDLDGTLIDSMPHHQAAWREWHARRQLTVDADAFFAATAGRSNAEIFADMFPGLNSSQYAELIDEREALYLDIASRALGLIAGADTYLEHARSAGCQLAVCTASTAPSMALAFRRFGIDRWVDATVSPADGLRGKPHPDVFLEGARRLGALPADCIVFEDAPLGIEAARRAGMRAVALTTTLPASAFSGFDNVIAIAADFTDPALMNMIPNLTSTFAKAKP